MSISPFAGHRMLFWVIAAMALTCLCLFRPPPAAQAAGSPAAEGSGQKEASRSAAAAAPKSSLRPLISGIRINTGAPGEERLVFTIQGKAAPTVFFIEGDPLRLVLDFPQAEVAPGVPSVILPGGKMIRQVRVGVHGEPERKVRVVLDLAAGRDYEIDEYFRPEEMIYELILRPSGGIDPADNSG